MQKNTIEILVGLVVLIAVIVFAVNAHKATIIKSNSESTKIIKGHFSNIDGIRIGSDVRVSGCNIGKVIAWSLEKTKELTKKFGEVEMQIQSDIELPLDTTAAIHGLGIFSSKYITLEPGISDEFLENGDSVEFTQSSVNIESIIGKLIFNSSDENTSETLKDSNEDYIKSDDLQNNVSNTSTKEKSKNDYDFRSKSAFG